MGVFTHNSPSYIINSHCTSVDKNDSAEATKVQYVMTSQFMVFGVLCEMPIAITCGESAELDSCVNSIKWCSIG